MGNYQEEELSWQSQTLYDKGETAAILKEKAVFCRNEE